MTEVRGVHFCYIKGGPYGDNFETFPFYQQHIRSFLFENKSKVTWLLGNTAGERDAYLIYHIELEDKVRRLLSVPLAKGGHFDGKVPTKEQIVRAYRAKLLHAIGVIDLGGTIIGTEIKKGMIHVWPGCRSANTGIVTRYYHFTREELIADAYKELKAKSVIRRNKDKEFPGCEHEVIFPFLARELGFEAIEEPEPRRLEETVLEETVHV